MEIDAGKVVDTLKRFGYLSPDHLGSNLKDPDVAKAIRFFQKCRNLSVDGVVGQKETMPAIDALHSQISSLPKEVGLLRAWRLTYYYIAEEDDLVHPTVPVFDSLGNKIATVDPVFFMQMSLEGTGFTRDGRALNVAGKNVPVRSEDYDGVYQAYKRSMPNRPPGYAGLVLDSTKTRVIAASSFRIVPKEKLGLGYGVIRGISLDPGFTLATDIGAYPSSDSRFYKKGGLHPSNLRSFIPELAGSHWPKPHDGFVMSNDTGGGIFGAHCDVFVGTRKISKNFPLKSARGHMWFPEIEKRVPVGYEYGLFDKV